LTLLPTAGRLLNLFLRVASEFGTTQEEDTTSPTPPPPIDHDIQHKLSLVHAKVALNALNVLDALNANAARLTEEDQEMMTTFLMLSVQHP
jgi:hypothetical protein